MTDLTRTISPEVEQGDDPSSFQVSYCKTSVLVGLYFVTYFSHFCAIYLGW